MTKCAIYREPLACVAIPDLQEFDACIRVTYSSVGLLPREMRMDHCFYA